MQAAFDPARIAAEFEAQVPPPEDILSLAQGIDLKDPLTATGYGAKEQRELGDLSDMLLKRASGSGLQDALDAIHALQDRIDSLDIASLRPSKGLLGALFSPEKRKAAALRRNYTELSLLVDRLANRLDMAGLALQKEMGLLDTLYESNRACYHALHRKILAGELALERQRASEGADVTSDSFADLFSARLSQLRQSKAICLQTALQIRLTQYNQQAVVDKLKQTTELALPLWKNQLALALNIHQQQAALDVYRNAARRSLEAMQQTEQAVREGSGDVAEKSQATLTELERLREADLELKRLMEETLQDIQKAKSAEA